MEGCQLELTHIHTVAIYRNTDTTTDLNKVSVIVPWATTVRQDSDFTITSSRVTINFTGLLKMYCNINYGTTSVARTAPTIQFFVDAVAHGSISGSTYNRATPNIQSSCNLHEILEVTDGEVIDVRCDVGGAIGIVAMRASGTSMLFFERLE